MITLRSIHLQTDLPAMARLYSLTRPETVTAQQVSDWWQAKQDEIRLTKAAVNEENQMIGMSDVQRESWMRPGHFWLQVIVDPKWRRQGIGSMLFDDGVRFGRTQGASVLESTVRDDDSASLRFAEQRGYQIERHSFDSTLDLISFDESKFADLIETVRAEGFRFFSFAETGPLSEESKCKLYELNRVTALDNPGNNRTFPSFDSFSKNVFEASWFRADMQLLAAYGEQWVGLSAVALYDEGNYAFNAFTGVLQAYRGRGIATALKLHAIRLAQRFGARYIRTNNDSLNAPMLAVNRKLGYRPETGLFQLVCSLIEIDNMQYKPLSCEY
jgi:GNAT superfamily N-acetyltransferase